MSKLVFCRARTQLCLPRAGWKACALISSLPSMVWPCQEGRRMGQKQGCRRHEPSPSAISCSAVFIMEIFPHSFFKRTPKDRCERGNSCYLCTARRLGEQLDTFSSGLCKSLVCPPRNHSIIQCLTLLSAKMLKHFLFLHFSVSS